jgi:hypothetical protein
MKKFFKIFGIVLILYVFWSFIFWTNVDKSIPIWSDLGVLEALIYLIIITIATYKEFIISLLIFSILIFLKKKQKIKLDNNILFILGYSFYVIILLILTNYLLSITSMTFDIERVSHTIFVPLIHSIIVFNILNSLMKEKNIKKSIKNKR